MSGRQITIVVGVTALLSLWLAATVAKIMELEQRIDAIEMDKP